MTLTFAYYYYLAQRISSIQRKPETKATLKLSVNSSNKIDLYPASVKCITDKNCAGCVAPKGSSPVACHISQGSINELAFSSFQS